MLMTRTHVGKSSTTQRLNEMLSSTTKAPACGELDESVTFLRRRATFTISDHRNGYWSVRPC